MPEPEPEPKPEPKPEPEPEPEPEEEDDTVGLSAQELDEMFGDDEPDGFQSIVAPDDDDTDDEFTDPDNIPEPDPIPQVFTAADDDAEPKPRKIGKIIGIAAGVVVVGLLVGGYAMKSTIVEMVPATTGLYKMIGLGAEKVGAGLQMKNIRSSRENENGLEILVVRGSVANISKVERTVPLIQVDLNDADGHSIQTAVAAPIRNKLAAGEEASFKARLVEPSPLARQVVTTFKAPDDDEAKEAAPAH